VASSDYEEIEEQRMRAEIHRLNSQLDMMKMCDVEVE
jgi:hypothetical protein